MTPKTKEFSPNRQTDWINCAKFSAIFAVLIDHTSGILYENHNIALASYYSVSLFILISGYLSYKSNCRHNYSYKQTVLLSCKRILLAYSLATLIYTVVQYKYFDYQTYIIALTHFNASGPFYYVLLYVQLMIVNKLIFQLLSFDWKPNTLFDVAKDITLGLIILFISSITTNYTNILGIYGGGGKLLGGTYLILFYIGMILAKYGFFAIHPRKILVIISSMSIFAYLIWWRFMCAGLQPALDSKVPFGTGFNPPSITFCVLALFMLFSCYGVFNILSWNSYLNYIPKFLGFLGKHTLYIFLYHKLWLDYFLVNHFQINNIVIKRIVYYLVMIFGSIGIEFVISIILKEYKKLAKIS